MARRSKNGISTWSIPQLLGALKKAENDVLTYRAELDRHRRLLDAAIGEGAGDGRKAAPKAATGRRRRRGAGRKLVDDAKLVTELKKAGRAGIAASELGKAFKLSGGQVSAVLQRLAREKLAKSNGVRGRGGRWRAL